MGLFLGPPKDSRLHEKPRQAWGKTPTLFLRSLAQDLELFEIFYPRIIPSLPTHFN